MTTSVEYIGKLFQARDIMHLAHLKSFSYAQHMALGDFYDGLLDHIDSIVECLQGHEGNLFSITIPGSTVQDPIPFLMGFRSMILEWRNSTDISYLQNQLDEITALTNKTIYKLKFLK